MKFCLFCKTHVEEDNQECPLCEGTLADHNPAEDPDLPKPEPKSKPKAKKKGK